MDQTKARNTTFEAESPGKTSESRETPSGIDDQDDLQKFLRKPVFQSIVRDVARKTGVHQDQWDDVAQETIQFIFTEYVAKRKFIANELSLAASVAWYKAQEVKRKSRLPSRFEVSSEQFWAGLRAPAEKTAEDVEQCLNVQLAVAMLPRDDQVLVFRRELKKTLRELSEATGYAVSTLHERERQLHSEMVAQLARHLGSHCRPAWPMSGYRILIEDFDYDGRRAHLPKQAWDARPYIEFACTPKKWWVADAIYRPFDSQQSKLSWLFTAARPDQVEAMMKLRILEMQYHTKSVDLHFPF